MSIFVSFASPDQRHAERIISFLEMHNFRCWVSYRDVGVGENYQESITRALRSATALMVIISGNANLSSEITKELSLASRYKTLVIPLRMEDVEPNDALSYELATRQWVDMYRDWNAGCERLLSQLVGMVPTEAAVGEAVRSSARAYSTPRAPAPAVDAPRGRPQTPSSPAMAPRELSRAVAAGLARPAAGGSVVVPPRQIQLNQPTAFADVKRPGDAAQQPRPSPSSAAPATAWANPAAPRRESRLIGPIIFVLATGVFGFLLVDWFRHGQPSALELVFWAILLIGCARLLRTIVRLCIGAGLRTSRA
jgi:hypothetical protein